VDVFCEWLDQQEELEANGGGEAAAEDDEGL
jgi:hypothetical protein